MENHSSKLEAFPYELISMMFKHAVGPDDDRRMEVVLSRVCGTWRQVALSTPMLWHRFSFRCPCSSSAGLLRLAVYLERSKSHPLALSFDFSICEDTARHASFVAAVAPHAARWRSFILLVDNLHPHIEFARKLHDLQVPLLEHINVRQLVRTGLRINRRPFPQSNVLRLGEAQKLKIVSVYLIAPGNYMPPLTNITALVIEQSRKKPVAFDTVLSLLQLPNLAFLSVKKLFVDSDSTSLETRLPPERELLLRKLRFLHISKSDLFLLVPYIKAPLLETLSLKNVNLRRPNVYLRSSYDYSSLHTLVLVDTRVDEPTANMEHIFEMTQTIRHLIISQTLTRYRNDAATAIMTQKDKLELGAWLQLHAITLDMARVLPLNLFCKNLQRCPDPVEDSARIRPYLRVHASLLHLWATTKAYHSSEALEKLLDFYGVNLTMLMNENTDMLFQNPVPCCNQNLPGSEAPYYYNHFLHNAQGQTADFWHLGCQHMIGQDEGALAWCCSEYPANVMEGYQ